MSHFGFSIGIKGEKQFKNALRDINQSFKVLGSEMNLVTSQFDKQDKSLQAMAARNNVLNKEIDAQKNKISTLEAALKNAANSFGQADRKTQNGAIQLNNAKADLNKMEKELDQNVQVLNEMEQSFDEAEEGTEQFADAVNDAAEQAEDASGKFEKIGGVLKGIGATIGAAVVAIGSAAIATGQELEELGEVAQNVYKHNFGANLEDVANGIGEVKKVTGLMGQELEKATEFGFALRDTLGFELQEFAKVLEEGTIDGYTVAAIDGTKLFGSYKKSCNECCSTNTRNKKTQYFHSAAFMSLIGKEPRLIMDFELYKGSEDSSKKDEGELTVAKRLLSKVCKEYRNILDVVVYDVLACSSSWINHCVNNKVIPIVHVKDNTITSIKEVKTKINRSHVKKEWQDEKRACKVKAYEETFKMDEVTEPLRFVKFSKKSKQSKYSQVLLITTDFNIPLQPLYKMMHMRWDIENSLFNKLKTYGALEHCFVHHPNAIEAILYLMSIASNLIQLFIFRRLSGSEIKALTQKEIIRLLEKGLYLLKYSRQYVFDTT